MSGERCDGGGTVELDGDEYDEGDDVVLSSRKNQYVVQTATPSESESDGEENERVPETPETPGVGWSEESVKVPGAPSKRRRVLPWTKEGREKFGVLVGEASCEETSDSEEEDVWRHGQTRGLFSSTGRRVDESGTNGSCCSSFVVEDDEESVVEELEEAEKDLGRTALEEFSVSLAEKAERLRRKLGRVCEELAVVERKLREYKDEEDLSDEVVERVKKRGRLR